MTQEEDARIPIACQSKKESNNAFTKSFTIPFIFSFTASLLYSLQIIMKAADFGPRPTYTMEDERCGSLASVDTHESASISSSRSSAAGRARAGEPGPRTFTKPKPFDIIVGSRGTHHSGPGNNRFNKTIDRYIPRYSKASTKSQKSDLFMEIYTDVSSFGRFLCNDANVGLFYEVGEYIAKEKISHALRYRKKRKLKASGLVGSKQVNSASTHLPLGAIATTNRLMSCLATSQPQYFVSQGVMTSPASALSSTSDAPPLKNLHGLKELFSDEDLMSVLGFPFEYK